MPRRHRILLWLWFGLLACIAVSCVAGALPLAYNVGFEIALVGALVTLGTGSLACIAALATFRRPSVTVPQARVVDKD